MLKHLRSHERGDTIVEVLISVAIISLVLVGAYLSSSHSTSTTQDAQEHSVALKLTQTQVEYLRAAGTLAAGATCFGSTGATTSGPGCAIIPSGSGIAYTSDISLTDETYRVKTTWDSVFGQGKSEVDMYYRVGP